MYKIGLLIKKKIGSAAQYAAIFEDLKRLLPNVRIYAYAYKKRISENTDMRIYAE